MGHVVISLGIFNYSEYPCTELGNEEMYERRDCMAKSVIHSLLPD